MPAAGDRLGGRQGTDRPLAAGGCDEASAQGKWLRQDLAAHPVACTLAYFHKPLFSSGGTHGNDPFMKPLWDTLYAANADVVVNGHDHDYERFAPQTPDGVADPTHGIREFVIGTGGKKIAFVHPESTHGVLVELYELTGNEPIHRLEHRASLADRVMREGQVSELRLPGRWGSSSWSMRNWMTETSPIFPATISGVMPAFVVIVGLAPCSASSFMYATSPFFAAT